MRTFPKKVEDGTHPPRITTDHDRRCERRDSRKWVFLGECIVAERKEWGKAEPKPTLTTWGPLGLP